MRHPDVSRRTLLKGGGAALAGLTVLRVAGPAYAFPGQQETVPLDDGTSGELNVPFATPTTV